MELSSLFQDEAKTFLRFYRPKLTDTLFAVFFHKLMLDKKTGSMHG